ncbi:protein HEG homolog 1 isoform 6-T6 [Menidia menidia]
MILTYLPVVFVVVAVAQGTTTVEISTVKVTAGGDTSNSPTTLHMTTSSNLNSKPTASSAGSPSTPASGGTASSASPETSYTSARLTPTRGDISPSARLTPTREHTAETTETHSPTAATSLTSDDTDRTTINVTTHQPTPPATSSSSITAAPSTPSPVIVCPAIPCPPESVCLNGTCQCLTGRYLLNGRCESGQVFPGSLHVTSLNFTNEMSDRSSRVFQETAAIISEPLREALKNVPGYLQTDVVELKPGSVVATVNNIFQDTTETEQSVDDIIKKAISNSTGVLSDATFTSTSLCEQTPKPCQVSTTSCKNINGQPVCSCKDGYVSDVYSNTSCRACPSGQRKVGEECQPCSFGYAGFNCNDSSLLALVIVSCVLGGLLLILILAFLIYWCWRKCSESKSGDNTSPYSSEDSSKPWPTAITPIPRASSNWDAAPSIEMAEGGSTHTLVDKKRYSNGLGSLLKQKGWRKSASYDLNPEDMKTFKGKNTSRYSYLVQGHENPYFLPGDEKRN